MKFYSLYSKSQKRYNVPFLAYDDADAIDRVAKMVSAQNDAALMSSLDDLNLCYLAVFDPSLPFPIHASPVSDDIILGDLHLNLPLPPMVKNSLDKFYAAKNSLDELYAGGKSDAE